MAVRERTYRPYHGPLTPDRRRFLIIPRYAYDEVFRSRWFLAVFVTAWIWPAVSVLIIYLHHNLGALAMMDVRPQELLPIDGEFFRRFFLVQGAFGFALAFLIGPGLVSRDLAHDALPMYLARPFSRGEYLLGKLAVLVILLSLISWIPALALFGFQSTLEGVGWATENAWLVGAILLGAGIGILLISLVTLALSAWVRWQALARGVLLGLFVFAAMVAEAINEIFRTGLGSVVNLGRMMVTVWDGLFGSPLSAHVPLWAAWASILVVCSLSLALLGRKIRAYEVVR